MNFNNITKKTWIYEKMCFILPLKIIRKTPNVEFYSIPDVFKHLNAIDKVIHKKGARSPMVKGYKGDPPWYFHFGQQDQLVVHEGKRVVELYTKKHGKIESFEVSANSIKHKGKIIFKGEAILGWPTHVFHRVHSPNGSISVNYAKRNAKFNMKNNFDIYSLETSTGKHEVIRAGHLDQPKAKK